MKLKAKKMMKNIRIIILVIFLIFAIISIHPNPGAEGVAIRNIIQNSSADLAGMENPKLNLAPMSREVIESISNIPIKDMEDYNEFLEKIELNRTYTIKTDKSIYRLSTQPLTRIIILNETERKKITEEKEVNTTLENGSIITELKNVSKFVTVNKTRIEVLGIEDIGLRVYNAPKNNIRKGLDLQGGTRVLLQPAEEVNKDDMTLIIDNMKQRLNVYGLSDISIRESGDLSGNQYIVVEIAGSNEEEVKNLISKQGKFEAKIGDVVVFNGGKRDITYVSRSADSSGIDPSTGCYNQGNGWICNFRFAISLRPEAARKEADITDKLSLITIDENGNAIAPENQYLSESLDLFLDDVLVNSLRISSELKGRVVTEISITGSGVGSTKQEASFDALNNMKELQTLLITGSLPVKLNIVKTDNLSPVLGGEFIKNALLIGILSIIAVIVVVFIVYRTFAILIPMAITMISEVVLLLGLASLIGWNLDLAAIAGIIIAVGTGVDDQIIITDETLRKDKSGYTNWKMRIKAAFFMIMGAYFATVVAMIPLISAGAGLVKGFALTTIMGVSFGVFITRPAYAAIIEILLKDKV